MLPLYALIPALGAAYVVGAGITVYVMGRLGWPEDVAIPIAFLYPITLPLLASLLLLTRLFEMGEEVWK